MKDNSNSGGESQQTGVIYLITNTLNGKNYVGKTKQKLEKRITQHKYDSRKGRPGLGAAIRKYGWENFSVEVLETCPVEMLNEREMFWIRELNSKAPNGYNLTDGGDGNSGFSYSPEARAKISAAHKGKPHSEEHKAKIAAAKKGKKRKPFSEEHKRKISEHHKANGVKPPGWAGRKHTPETIAKIIESNKRTWARKKAVENDGNS